MNAKSSALIAAEQLDRVGCTLLGQLSILRCVDGAGQ